MHHAVHDVGIANEVCNKGILRLIVNILRRADLLHLAAVHDHDGIGHGKGFLLIVGNINKGNVHFALQALQLQLHLLAQLEVQCAKGLIQQKDLRLVHQTAGDGHALLLAAGHLADAAALEAFQANNFQHVAHLAADGLFVHLFEPQTEGHVLEHVQVREQCVFLKNGVHRALIGRHAGNVLTFQQHFAGIGFQKTCDQTQGGGFAAAGRAQQRYELFVMDVEVQPIQNALTVKFHYDIPQ